MERVFSILRCCFDERQQSVYSDRICASALLKYNRGRAGVAQACGKTEMAQKMAMAGCDEATELDI